MERASIQPIPKKEKEARCRLVEEALFVCVSKDSAKKVNGPPRRKGLFCQDVYMLLICIYSAKSMILMSQNRGRIRESLFLPFLVKEKEEERKPARLEQLMTSSPQGKRSRIRPPRHTKGRCCIESNPLNTLRLGCV